MRTAPGTRLALLAASALLQGCSQTATSVLVQLDSDAPARLLSVRAVLRAGELAAAAGAPSDQRTFLRDAGAGSLVPASFGLLPGRGAASDPFVLQLEATFAPSGPRQPSVLVRRTARFRFQSRRAGALRFFLSASCAAEPVAPAQCQPSPEPCTVARYCEERSPAQTCGDDGRCTDLDVTPTPLDLDASADALDAPLEQPLLDAAAEPAPDVADVLSEPSYSVRVALFPGQNSSWATLTPAGAGPTERVQAAFAAPGSGEVIALTQTEFAVLSATSMRWTERRPRDEVFPELAGVPVREGEDVVLGSNELLSLNTFDGAWQYHWDNALRRASGANFVPRASFPAAEWGSPLAPPTYEVFGLYFRPSNPEPWISGDPTSVAGCEGAPHSVGPYLAWLSDDGFGPVQPTFTVYDLDCFRFVQRDRLDNYQPWSLADAPAYGSFSAVTWSDRLFVFLR